MKAQNQTRTEPSALSRINANKQFLARNLFARLNAQIAQGGVFQESLPSNELQGI